MGVKHAFQTLISDDGTSDVGSNEWNAEHVIDESGLLIPNFTTEPAAPASGNTRLISRRIANHEFLCYQNSEGFDSIIQPAFFTNDVCYWKPQGNGTAVSNQGFTFATLVGTATARNIATTNLATRSRRYGIVSAATAGALLEHRQSVLQWTIGTGTAGLGGLFHACRFVQSNAAAVTGERFFHGYIGSTAAATNVEPSTLVNCFGVAKLSTSNNLHIVYGGSAAQTPIDLGANFPANTLSADLYEVYFYAPAAVVDTVHYEVVRLNTGDRATGTLTAATAGVQLPLSTALLTLKTFKTNNATALAVAVDLSIIYNIKDN